MSSPAWQVSEWLNTPKPLSLDALRGRVVVVEVFQMLCPGCVSHGLPQALRVHRGFAPEQVQVLGLHSVFEHHDVMPPAALRVFLSENRIDFPVGIDRPGTGPIPHTMASLGLRGTPSTLVYDREGGLRLSHFGALDDLALGAVIGQLLQ